jgi:hypothetical protein
VPPDEQVTLAFPDAFEASWIRARVARACRTSVQLTYR